MAGRPRLAAPDRRRQILDAACGLFARQGFSGATTRQIAEHAHITEALIFRHFPNKEDLYWAVLEDKLQRKKQRHFKMVLANGNGHGPEEVFSSIAEDILRRNSEDTT